MRAGEKTHTYTHTKKNSGRAAAHPRRAGRDASDALPQLKWSLNRTARDWSDPLFSICFCPPQHSSFALATMRSDFAVVLTAAFLLDSFWVSLIFPSDSAFLFLLMSVERRKSCAQSDSGRRRLLLLRLQGFIWTRPQRSLQHTRAKLNLKNKSLICR